MNLPVQEDIGDFVVVYTPGTHHVSFKIFEIGGRGANGQPVFVTDGEFSDSVEKAEIFLDGDIKWDGCSNWDFHTNECMMHCCGRENATRLGDLLGRLYDITARVLPTYDKALGG